MKFNKRKKSFKIKKKNYGGRKEQEDNSEIESDDILSSEASESANLRTKLGKKKKRHIASVEGQITDEDATDGDASDGDASDLEEDGPSGDENGDAFNNPEERKIHLAKKYLRDMGIQSSDEEKSQSDSPANSDEEDNSDSNFSDNRYSHGNEEQKERITKLMMQRERQKSRKALLNLGNKIKIVHDEKLAASKGVVKRGPACLNRSGGSGGSGGSGESGQSGQTGQRGQPGKSSQTDLLSEEAFFFRGHKKSVTCVACPDFNLSFFDYYEYDAGTAEREGCDAYAGYNSGKFYREDNPRSSPQGDDPLGDDAQQVMQPKVFPNVSLSTAYTGGKDACIIEWDLARGEKVHIYKGNPSAFQHFGRSNGISHFKSVMDLYCHKFNSFFISVGADNLISTWDNRVKKTCTHSIVGHKNVISAIVGSNENTDELNMEYNFFTSSYDKSIKLWDLRFLEKCINTYMGHTNNILSMTSLTQNKLITSSSDYTLRFWNTKNDNHLLFNLNYEIVESCCSLNNRVFIAGTFSGHIYILSSSYKKPICICKNAHNSYAVTALVSIPFTDIFISGSYDGYVNFWQYKSVSKTSATMRKVLAVPVDGAVSKFSFSPNYAYLFAAVGDEMKHGKWTRTRSRNGLAVIPLRFLR
ncbi:U3 small nucleolar RNA-interacting protein 2, putative [Plasmodium vivax]|uniref:U3 small nucleolar RNA-interacting protein 2, putative n=1 Tax=Plasmodium vivax TaxID=5855 RepID=A0A1G4H584_PLAVI|nr:U3 small nucleolar RNA-interacting protein 2, putative [Plasmodium vivax]